MTADRLKGGLKREAACFLRLTKISGHHAEPQTKSMVFYVIVNTEV